MKIEKIIHCYSISEDINSFKNDLIKECLDQRKQEEGGLNFKLQTKHLDKLYDIFIDCSKKILKPFTLEDNVLKVWCYVTDKSYNLTGWHDHKKSATINAVIYLQTKNKGVFFKHGKEHLFLKPDDGDMLIFPASLEHKPEPSISDERISLNLELRCNESEEDIF